MRWRLGAGEESSHGTPCIRLGLFSRRSLESAPHSPRRHPQGLPTAALVHRGASAREGGGARARRPRARHRVGRCCRNSQERDGHRLVEAIPVVEGFPRAAHRRGRAQPLHQLDRASDRRTRDPHGQARRHRARGDQARCRRRHRRARAEDREEHLGRRHLRVQASRDSEARSSSPRPRGQPRTRRSRPD